MPHLPVLRVGVVEQVCALHHEEALVPVPPPDPLINKNPR